MRVCCLCAWCALNHYPYYPHSHPFTLAAAQSPDPADTDWKSDYAAKGYEYFDVWAPEIATSYSEAFWTDQV